ncbi:MAG: hypothetical protein M3Q81_00525 [bacterium]|nr:hypothetical protein [bacterium]
MVVILFKQLLILLGLILIACLEQVYGPPILFIGLLLLQLKSDAVSKIAWLMVSVVVIAVLYNLAFVLALLILGSTIEILHRTRKNIKNVFSRVIFLSCISGLVIALLAQYYVGSAFVISSLFSILILTILTQGQQLLVQSIKQKRHHFIYDKV